MWLRLFHSKPVVSKKGNPEMVFGAIFEMFVFYFANSFAIQLVIWKTGSMSSWMALWDCSEDAISSFIGYKEVAQEAGSKLAPQNSPIVQFDTTLNQSQAELQHILFRFILFFFLI